MAAVWNSNGAVITGSLDSAVVPIPACNIDDLLFIPNIIECGAAGRTITAYNTPSGWTALPNTGTGARRGAAGYYKLAEAGDTSGVATVTVTITSSAGLALITAQCARYTGNATSAPVHLTGAAGTTNSTAPAPASIGPTTENDELAVAGIGYLSTTATIGDISGGWSKSAAESAAATNGTICFQHKALPTSGTTESGGTATLSTTAIWGVLSFAIKGLVAVTPVLRDPAHSPSHQAQMAS